MQTYRAARSQREQQEGENLLSGQVRTDAAQKLPPALKRRYRVYFKPLSKPEVMRLRDVRAKDVGKLVTVKARGERKTSASPTTFVPARRRFCAAPRRRALRP